MSTVSLDSLPRSSFVTKKGHEWSYTHMQGSKQKQPILLLHGFPSHSGDWIRQIEYFTAQGHEVLVPDLLGFGWSTKPDDASDYRHKVMSDDLAQLLEHLQLQRVIGVGHNLGAVVLSRFAAYYPEFWQGLVFLSVGPPALGSPFDVDMVNEMTKKAMGYELTGYMKWLGTDPDAQVTLEKHAEAAMDVMFAADRAVWSEWFHPLGKMKQFVSEDRRVEVGSWYGKELQREHLKVYGRPDGYKGVVRWYQMFVENLQIPDEEGLESYKITAPALFILSKERPGAAYSQKDIMKGWMTDLRIVELDSGHWIQLEQAAETNKAINEFIDGLG